LLIPETGSDFELGQTLREDFFFDAAVAESPLANCPASVLDGVAGIVDADELDPIEEEEFDLCRVFRGINIRETSSGFIEDRAPCPPSPESYHPKRCPVCTLGGEATAVMEKAMFYVEGVMDARRSYFMGAEKGVDGQIQRDSDGRRLTNSVNAIYCEEAVRRGLAQKWLLVRSRPTRRDET
jgi:hypothetical protein